MKNILQIFTSIPERFKALRRKTGNKSLIVPAMIGSLAPKTISDPQELEKIEPYLSNLKTAIDTPGINNIAITGSFGSGKSTILNTFQHQYRRDYEYLRISLASFNDNDGNKDGLDKKLEVSILQQIFYHVKPSEIPDSRFKRIINLTDKKLIFQAVCFLIWLFSAFALFRFDYINKLDPRLWSLEATFDVKALIFLLLFACGIGMFTKLIIRIIGNSKINKVNIKGELELGDAADKSVFNQHLEEILYFFERTAFNVVFIEDIDRFDNTDIFTKMREINILINHSRVINRKIKFVYAVKDDMFRDKNERVKFFEFIIPVIPFINPSNAGEQMAALIKKASLENVLSREFTEDVVTFIDDIDMRLLINIFQEYLIYRSQLSSDLEQDKLFAIIVYKNLHPDDFADLAKRKGNLFELLTNREVYVADLKQSLHLQIGQINSQLEKLNHERQIPIAELRAIYLNKIIAKIPNFAALNVEGEINLTQAVEDKYFNIIRQSKNIQYAGFKHYHGTQYFRNELLNSNIKFSDIENEISAQLPYSEREKLITDKVDAVTEKLKEERESFKQKMAELDSLSLQEIFEQVDIKKHIGVFEKNYLVRSLILNGYINENYNDYISLFHEVNLTKEDFAFERKIKSGIQAPFDYKLSKTESLIKRLPEKYFKREVSLNFDLLNALAEHGPRFPGKYDSHLKLLAKDEKNTFEFLNRFMDTKPAKISIVIKSLTKYKKRLLENLLATHDLPAARIREWLLLIFSHGDLPDILKLVGQEKLVAYINEMEDFFEFSALLTTTKTFEGYVQDKKVKLGKMDSPTQKTGTLFDFVYTNNYYKINQHNIELILAYTGKPQDLILFRRSQYTILKELNVPHLLNYISKHLEEYVDNVLIKIPENKFESLPVIISILNSGELTPGCKEDFIKSQEATITNVADITDNEIRRLVVKNNKMQASWANVFEYYSSVSESIIDEILKNFLNIESNYRLLTKSKLNNGVNLDEETIKKLSGNIIDNVELSFDAYTSLLRSIPYTYNKLDYSLLTEEKVTWMIEEKFVNQTKENYDGIRANFPPLHMYLTAKNINTFLSEYKTYELVSGDYIELLRYPQIVKSKKSEIIRDMDEDMIIETVEIATLVLSILSVQDLSAYRFEIIEAICKANGTLEKKLDLIVLKMDALSEDQVKSLTGTLGEDYGRIFKEKNRPVFKNNSSHLAFAEKLKEKDFISSFDIQEKGIQIVAKYSS